jgi:hypothetical protein
MIADEAMISSLGLTLSEGGVTADEATVGSYRRAPFGGRMIVNEVTVGPSREGPTSDMVMPGSCRPRRMTEASIGVAGPSRGFGMGS